MSYPRSLTSLLSSAAVPPPPLQSDQNRIERCIDTGEKGYAGIEAQRVHRLVEEGRFPGSQGFFLEHKDQVIFRSGHIDVTHGLHFIDAVCLQNRQGKREQTQSLDVVVRDDQQAPLFAEVPPVIGDGVRRKKKIFRQGKAFQAPARIGDGKAEHDEVIVALVAFEVVSSLFHHDLNVFQIPIDSPVEKGMPADHVDQIPVDLHGGDVLHPPHQRQEDVPAAPRADDQGVILFPLGQGKKGKVSRKGRLQPFDGGAGGRPRSR